MRRGKRTSLVIVIFIVLLGVCGPVSAVEVFEPGYVAETYVTYSKAQIGIPRGMVFDDDGNLYVVQNKDESIWKITPEIQASEFVSGLNQPRGIAWTGGTSYGNYLYVSNSSRIVRISLDGTRVNFAYMPDDGSTAVSVDRTGNYGGYMYTADASTDRIYQLDINGNDTTFGTFPGWTAGGGPYAIDFDLGTDYGGSMYVATSFTTTPSKSGVFVLDNNGNATRFANDLASGDFLKFDPIGDFGGEMFLSANNVITEQQEIWCVHPDGTSTKFARTTTSSPRGLAFGPDGALYVAEYDADSETVIISRISAWRLVGLEITGPDAVAENFQAQYKAIAHYDNGGTADVTGSAEWSVDDETIASITAGLLTTEPIDLPTDIIITAEYNEGEVTVGAEKDVSIFAICPSGSALEFDGVDDYVEVNDDSSLRFSCSDSFSISFWVKLFDDGFILSKMRTSQKRGVFGYEIRWEPSRFSFNLESSFIKNVNLFTPENSAPAGSWYYVATVYDNRDMKIYLNGELVNSGTFDLDTGSTTPDKNLAIGARSYDSTITRYLNGTIDELAIYNRALSAEEIQMLMHTRPESDDPNLVGYWAFDEGEGQVAGDLSLYGNDGTLGSGPDEDASDPNWTDSIPPVGICSVEGIVERNLLNIFGMKNDVLDILNEAIGKEEALWEYMDIVFKDRDFGNTSKGDLVKAKQKIHSAIQHEEQASTAVDKSIEKLEDALDALDIE